MPLWQPKSLPVGRNKLFSLVFSRQPPVIEDDIPINEVLKAHTDKLMLSTNAKTLYIRRSRPFSSLIREISKVDLLESDTFEVKFSDSLSTVDDTGPRRDFLRRCLIDMKENSGIFSSVGEGSYTVTHNLEKLLKHDYFSAGRAMAMSLVFGGPAPSFLTESVYRFITEGYDDVQPRIAEVLPTRLRDLLWKVCNLISKIEECPVIIRDSSSLLCNCRLLNKYWTGTVCVKTSLWIDRPIMIHTSSHPSQTLTAMAMFCTSHRHMGTLWLGGAKGSICPKFYTDNHKHPPPLAHCPRDVIHPPKNIEKHPYSWTFTLPLPV